MTDSPELVAARRLLSVLVAGRESVLGAAGAHLPFGRVMALREAADPTAAAMVLDHRALARQLDVQLAAWRPGAAHPVEVAAATGEPGADGFSVRPGKAPAALASAEVAPALAVASLAAVAAVTGMAVAADSAPVAPSPTVAPASPAAQAPVPAAQATSPTVAGPAALVAGGAPPSAPPASAAKSASPARTSSSPDDDTAERTDPPTNVTPVTPIPMRPSPASVDPFRASLPPLPGARAAAEALKAEAAGMGPAKPPVKAEPAKAEPAKPPAKAEPVKAEPVKPPAKAEPVRPPAKAEPAKAEPAKAEPAKAEPVRPTAKVEPAKAEPPRTTTAKVDAAPPRPPVVPPAPPPPPAPTVAGPPKPPPAAPRVGPPPMVAAPPRVPGPPPSVPMAPPGSQPPSRLGAARPVAENLDPNATTVFKASEVPFPTRPGEPPAGRRSEPARPPAGMQGTGFQPITESDFIDDDPSEVTSVLHVSEIPPMLTRETAPPARRATTVVPVPSARPAARAPEEAGFPTIADPSQLGAARTVAAPFGAPRAAPAPVPAGMEAGALRDIVRALGVEDDDGEVLLDEMEEADLGAPIIEPDDDEAVFQDDEPHAVAVAHVATRAAEEYVIEGDDDPRDAAWAPGGDTPRAPRLTDDDDYGHTPPPPTTSRPVDSAADLARARQMMQDARNSSNRGDIQASIQHYSDALDLRPDLVDAWLGRGRSHLDLGDYSSAMSDFQRAEDLGPDSPEPHVAMGDLYYARKEYKRAIEFYDHAIEVDGSHAMARCLRGMSHYYRKNYKQALQDLERSFSLNPEIPNIRKYMQMASNKLKSS